MKTLLLLAAAGAFSTLSFTACSTAHQAAEDTEYVAKRAGHAVGHGMEETGEVISHGGEKLERRTSER